MGSYLIDQEMYKNGEKFMDRISDIKVKIDQLDPINFYDPAEETSDEEHDVPTQVPKVVKSNKERFRYGPRKSFLGTITRRKKRRAQGKDDSDTSKSDPANDPNLPRLTVTEDEVQSPSPPPPPPPPAPPLPQIEGDATQADDVTLSLDVNQEKRDSKKSDARSSAVSGGLEVEPIVSTTQIPQELGDPTEAPQQQKPSFETDVVMQAAPGAVVDEKSTVEVAPADDDDMFPPIEPALTEQKLVKTEESSTVQKFMSKIQETTIAPEAKEGLAKELLDSAQTPAPKKTPGARIGALLAGKKGKSIEDKGDKTDEQAAEGTAAAMPPTPGKGDDKPVPAEGVAPATAPQTTEETVTTERDVKSAPTTPAEQAAKTKGKGFSKFGKAVKLVASEVHTTSVLSLLKKKKQAEESSSKSAAASMKKKVKKFKGGQASKMLAAVSQRALASTGHSKVKHLHPPPTRGTRSRLTQTTTMKQIMDDVSLDVKKSKKKHKTPKGESEVLSASTGATTSTPATPGKKAKKGEKSEASKALMIEVETKVETSVLRDPNLQFQIQKEAKEYEGTDTEAIVAVDHCI